MKLILQAIKSLLNKINIRIEALENKTSDENIADGKFLPDGTPFTASFPYSFSERLTNGVSIAKPDGTIYDYSGRSALNLTVGNAYTVSYNGKEYECECKLGRYVGNNGYYLGNGEFVESESSSEPFAVFVSDATNEYKKYDVITKEDIEAVELSITGENEYIRKMDERLLPNGTRPLVIDASRVGVDVTIESGHIFRDVFLACSEEKRDAIIRCDYNGYIYVYRLNQFDGGVFVFTYIESWSTHILHSNINWYDNGQLTYREVKVPL